MFRQVTGDPNCNLLRAAHASDLRVPPDPAGLFSEGNDARNLSNYTQHWDGNGITMGILLTGQGLDPDPVEAVFSRPPRQIVNGYYRTFDNIHMLYKV